MNIPILSLVFHTMPESFALIFVTLVLLKVRISWGFILFLSILQTVAVYFARLLPLAFGVHSVVLMLLLTVFVAFVFKMKFTKVLPVVIASFIMLFLFEFAVINSIMFVANINLDMLLADDLLKLLVTTPQWLLLFLTGFIIQYSREKMKNSKEVTL